MPSISLSPSMPSQTTTDKEISPNSSQSSLKLALLLAGTIIAALIIVILLIFCWRRTRQQKKVRDSTTKVRTTSDSRHTISSCDSNEANSVTSRVLGESPESESSTSTVMTENNAQSGVRSSLPQIDHKATRESCQVHSYDHEHTSLNSHFPTFPASPASILDDLEPESHQRQSQPNIPHQVSVPILIQDQQGQFNGTDSERDPGTQTLVMTVFALQRHIQSLEARMNSDRTSGSHGNFDPPPTYHA
ncbi:hypothetical protein VKT23_010509 [Stygiomarasmius scandens]|uniref:Uncharacterized protein n=1 Tax=Marasmiellus scandens TaxID=2682957 RepID=A0ABR1JEH8_9AGAR